MEKSQRMKKKVLLTNILLPAVLIILFLIISNYKRTSDYNNCVSSYRDLAYKGRSDETRSWAAAQNIAALAKYTSTCSGFFLQQPIIPYLFSGPQREKSIKMYCDDFARDIELNAEKWKADPLSVVFPFYENVDYSKSYTQCIHQFGI